jgi:dTDP-4-amino-4,6-dideoxygalactose transaminase
VYIIRCADRTSLKASLARHGVTTGIHYPIPVHLQPACGQYGYTRGDFLLTERLADEILSLPMYAELTPEHIEWVATMVVELQGDAS